jgi:hypothetical protein
MTDGVCIDSTGTNSITAVAIEGDYAKVLVMIGFIGYLSKPDMV